MNIDKFLTSKLFKGIMVGLSALVILLVGFGLGMAVGIKKSEFSYRWQENRPMMGLPGRDGGFFRQLNGRDFMNSHGIVGQVSKIDGSVLTIKDRDNTEKSVLTDDKTAIETAGKPAKISDLKAGDTVVIIGDPDDKGEIQAKLIRTMPSGQTFPPNPSMNPPADATASKNTISN